MDIARILVAEDDKEINKLVKDYLTREGFILDNAFDGRQALEYITNNSYQMVILDLMMPYMDGYELLRKIREKANIPVLILSAKSNESDKIIGLSLGADDYLTKPFSIAELAARVKAQLRRYLNLGDSTAEVKKLSHLDIQMDLQEYSVSVSGRNIQLSAKEFEILKLFLTNPKRVFTKSQIFNTVWKEDFMADENTVMVHIRRLREKIEADPSKPRYIQTVWGIGYKLGEV